MKKLLITILVTANVAVLVLLAVNFGFPNNESHPVDNMRQIDSLNQLLSESKHDSINTRIIETKDTIVVVRIKSAKRIKEVPLIPISENRKLYIDEAFN